MKSTTFLAATALAASVGAGAARSEPFQGPSVGLEVAYEDYGMSPEGDAVYALVLGYDHRVSSNWVVGAGLRYTFDGASASETSLTSGGLLQTSDVSIDNQWALTGRLGRLLNDKILMFAEGGYERFDVNAQRTLRNEVCAPPSGCVISRDDFSFDEDLWTIGVGVEWAVSDHVRLRGAYAYGESDALDRNRFSIAASYVF